MPTTPLHALPYPAPTDPADVPLDMQELATALDSALLPTDIVVAAATRILASKLVASDAQPAFRIYGNGKLEWGAGGSGAVDTSLSRTGPSNLEMSGSLDVVNDVYTRAYGLWVGIGLMGPASEAGLSVGGGSHASLYRAADGLWATPQQLKTGHNTTRELTLSDTSLGGAGVKFGTDVNLWRSNAGYLSTDAWFEAFDGISAGLSNATPIILSGDGYMYFGAAWDTNLYRSAPNTLKTDDSLVVAGNLTVSGTSNLAPTLVTALPGSPANGQEVVYTDSLTAPTYYWHLRFNSTTGKWHYLGGAPLRLQVDADEAPPADLAWVNLTTPTSITVPLAGDYLVEATALPWNTNNDGARGQVGIAIGDTTPLEVDKGSEVIPNANGYRETHIARLKTFAASDLLKLRYWRSGGSVSFRGRSLFLTPMRVG